MTTLLKNALRFRVYHPLRYAADLSRGRIGARVRGEPAPLRVLLVSDNRHFTSEQQFAPLLSDRTSLRRRLGLAIDHRRVEDVLARPQQSIAGFDVVVAKLSFELSEAEAMNIMGRLRERSGAARLIYFDGDDDACVEWGQLPGLVDLYVKKHVFADPAWYGRRFMGKNNLTDYVARTHAVPFDRDIIPHSGSVEPRFVSKIVPGYNIGLDDKVRDLFRLNRSRMPAVKDIDIVCRASAAPGSWIYPLRSPVADALSPLEGSRRVLLPNQRVDQEQYYEEMRRSRICVSPFGYGEICWRDFEAVLCGCLLVKPDMSHIRTEPDIFVPYETYIPVKWDFSDLAAVCERCLSDQSEIDRITKGAYEVLANYYREERFIDCIGRLLGQAGLREPVSL